VSVAAGRAPSHQAKSWGVTYRFDTDEHWSECRLLDISLDGGVIELCGAVSDGSFAEQSLFLQIDSIADDEIGITMPATVQRIERAADGSVVAEVAFSARREERMLLHLLVRLHELV
jgi:hypothetical protein